MQYPECERCSSFVGPISFWGNLGLTLLKGVIGYISGSRAVVADAIHSGGDVIMGVFIYVSLKLSGKPATDRHHYGHGKIEFIASAIVGILLLFIGAMIVSYSFIALYHGDLDEPGALAAFVTIFSIIANEVMARHSICAGKQMNSSAMWANGLENRADAFSSVAALFGVMGAKFGFLWLDPLAAFVVGLFIFHSTYVILKEAFEGLLDKAEVDTELKTEIVAIIAKCKDILSVNYVWSRRNGQKKIVTVGVTVPPELTTREGNRIREGIVQEMKKKIENIDIINLKLIPQEST
ncbi:MAG: cation transporter [Deltaproteobacteria bacterium]|nr:cation transporter [Deltaproteobacteria bacterium]